MFPGVRNNNIFKIYHRNNIFVKEPSSRGKSKLFHLRTNVPGLLVCPHQKAVVTATSTESCLSTFRKLTAFLSSPLLGNLLFFSL